MHETKQQSFLKGAAILAAASVFVRIVGVIYKIPIASMLGAEGTGYFQVTYNIYALILAISTVGLPVALSRLISSANAQGNTGLVKRYYSVAMPTFMIIGIVSSLVMIFFADTFADLMNSSYAAFSIRIIAPAVFFVCMISVYRGYAQGFGNMVPTALSQVIEVLAKTAIGITTVLILLRLNYDSYILSGGAILGVSIGAGLCIPMLMWKKRNIDKGITYHSESDSPELPSKRVALKQIMKVTIPITLTASSIAIMTAIDQSVVMGRLQSVLHLTEREAASQYGLFAQSLMIFNLPPSFILPLAVSIIPAVASSIAKKRTAEASGIIQSAWKIANLLAMPAAAGLIVLAGPIMSVLFPGASQSPENLQTMTTIMMFLGAASFFVCLHHVNTSILQASGLERVAMLTFPIGAVLRIAISFFLVGHPRIGVIGSAVGALVCFAVVSTINLLVIIFKVKERPKFIGAFLKPLMCASLMAVTTYFAHSFVFRFGSAIFGAGYTASIFYLLFAISIGIIAYIILIVVSRTVIKQDFAHIPKGKKIAKLLRVR